MLCAVQKPLRLLDSGKFRDEFFENHVCAQKSLFSNRCLKLVSKRVIDLTCSGRGLHKPCAREIYNANPRNRPIRSAPQRNHSTNRTIASLSVPRSSCTPRTLLTHSNFSFDSSMTASRRCASSHISTRTSTNPRRSSGSPSWETQSVASEAIKGVKSLLCSSTLSLATARVENTAVSATFSPTVWVSNRSICQYNTTRNKLRNGNQRRSSENHVLHAHLPFGAAFA